MSYFALIVLLAFLIVILTLLSTVIGKFPEPLHLVEKRTRKIIEVLGMWTFVFIFLAFFQFSIIPSLVTSIADNTLLEVYIAIYLSVATFLIPLFYVLVINKWKRRDFGIFNKVGSWTVALFGIVSYLGIGVLTFFIFAETGFPLEVLLIFLYSNAFLEEFFYRAILQSKLEKALGQKNSIIFGGILFGLIHIPANIYTFIYINADIVGIIFTFSIQTIHGWIYGIIYTKTRNIFPSVICHYLSNWTSEILFLFL